MKELQTEIFDLSCGMRLVCRKAPLALEYFGVAVNSGSRDEKEGEFGLAHFVEHTIFKGTDRRRAGHIINRMEAVGGDLNAFTSKEETNVYSVFPRGNLSRAIDLIADLLANSRFPLKEIDREREVVRDEIDSYLDSPSEAVYDDFEDLFFAGSQLGHNILGNDTDLDRFSPDVCREYLTGNFHGGRMVAYYLGPESAARVSAKVNRGFAGMRSQGRPLDRKEPQPLAPFNVRRETDTHQSHTVVGARLPGLGNPKRDAIALVTNILGGPGMNSRLNVSLRERRGLVYTVEASTTMFSDCGLFNIYFGCDPADRDRCLELVGKELRQMADNPLTAARLAAAKKQYLGQMVVASENLEQGILSTGRALLMTGKVRSRRMMEMAVESLTGDDIAEVAEMLRPEKCSVLSLG
ncbi:MAG: insulinase family protein [Muribaculaceae bacterium]|nr:insulinase family protein [Muribaculaceae bacterium]MDE6360490.1 insulinase family protein [Muribaculaceae bacterium]